MGSSDGSDGEIADAEDNSGHEDSSETSSEGAADQIPIHEVCNNNH